MQEGKTGDTVKKRHDSRTLVKAVCIRMPRLQCAAGYGKPLGRLPLGKALGFEIAIPLQQLSELGIGVARKEKAPQG